MVEITKDVQERRINEEIVLNKTTFRETVWKFVGFWMGIKPRRAVVNLEKRKKLQEKLRKVLGGSTI